MRKMDSDDSMDETGNTSEESVNIDSEGDCYSSDDETRFESEAENDDRGVEGSWKTVVEGDQGPNNIPFTAIPGPKSPPGQNAKPIDYAKLFIDDELIDKIVLETNRYAEQWISRNRQSLDENAISAVKQWRSEGRTSRKEMYAFFGVIFNMSLVCKPSLDSYWDTSHLSQRTHWFPEHFSYDRFLFLLKFMHFSDNDFVNQQNKLDKLSHVAKHFNKLFQRYYHPGKDISLHEGMIGYQGKSPHLTVYMPNKQLSRSGVKLWCLCDSASFYTYAFEVSKSPHDPSDKASGRITHDLVMRLMSASDLLHKGHHIALDNYLTSPRLLTDLFKEKTTATGTVKPNRNGLPQEVLEANLQNKEVCERQKENMLCVAYKDGMNQPILLSTQASGGYCVTKTSKGKERKEPNSVALYNQSWGRLDMSESKFYVYLSENGKMKWTKKVVFALMERALLNSFIIYQERHSEIPKMCWESFMISLIEDMVGNFKSFSAETFEKEHDTDALDETFCFDSRFQPFSHVCTLQKLDVGKSRGCVYNHGKRTRTNYLCKQCNVGLCPPCFEPYHKKNNKPVAPVNQKFLRSHYAYHRKRIEREGKDYSSVFQQV